MLQLPLGESITLLSTVTPHRHSDPSPLPYGDWAELNRGDRVHVQRPGESPSEGCVDDVAENASFFWVWLDHGKGRVMICEGDGTTVWRL
jgi:hypothetical protein